MMRYVSSTLLRLATLSAIPIAATLFAPIPASASSLEVQLHKYDTGGANYAYDIFFGAIKEGASSASLQTPSGTFGLNDIGNWFVPAGGFQSTYTGLSFQQLSNSIASSWVLTWDKGLQTETIASIGFGAVNENEWLAVPFIIKPVDGATVSPQPTIDWGYSVPVLDAQQDSVTVLITVPGITDLSQPVIDSGGLPLNVTSWVPPAPLSPGTWWVTVDNGVDIRRVEDGIGGGITGDPWVLENEDWLSLNSIDTVRIAVAPVPEPGTILLFGGGIGLLAARRACRRT